MWSKRPLTVLLTLVTLLLANCSNNLTRTRALAMLNKDALPPVTDLEVTLESFRLARDNGFFESGPDKHAIGEASKYFDTYWWFAGAATLKVPLKRRAIEVTGIKDTPMDKNSKVVQFTWEYIDVPEEINRYTGTTAGVHSGEALFKLYDDGWRIDGLQLN
jgi:hypothetical protein